MLWHCEKKGFNRSLVFIKHVDELVCTKSHQHKAILPAQALKISVPLKKSSLKGFVTFIESGICRPWPTILSYLNVLGVCHTWEFQWNWNRNFCWGLTGDVLLYTNSAYFNVTIINVFEQLVHKFPDIKISGKKKMAEFFLLMFVLENSKIISTGTFKKTANISRGVTTFSVELGESSGSNKV